MEGKRLSVTLDPSGLAGARWQPSPHSAPAGTCFCPTAVSGEDDGLLGGRGTCPRGTGPHGTSHGTPPPCPRPCPRREAGNGAERRQLFRQGPSVRNHLHADVRWVAIRIRGEIAVKGHLNGSNSLMESSARRADSVPRPRPPLALLQQMSEPGLR